MRQTILAAAAAFVIGGVATGAALSQAQQTPAAVDGRPGDSTSDGAINGRQSDWASDMPEHHEGPGQSWMGWAHHMHHGQGLRAFALIYRQPDRQLTPADVQKIAEAFLLWNGNHSWRVTNVALTADGPIGFSLSSPEGSVIATFTMNPHTARITRVG